MESIVPETRTSPVSISSSITLVINTQGPGPFTFNINLTGGALTSTPEGLSFTVNAVGQCSTDSSNSIPSGGVPSNSGVAVPARARGADMR
ncbi:hypothetical protein B0H13DRAFT_2362449 [Mycena leptocephala]|nr:hypothetical protein B0H13DRAFT_2362449 [Mycena leptocephala]